MGNSFSGHRRNRHLHKRKSTQESNESIESLQASIQSFGRDETMPDFKDVITSKHDNEKEIKYASDDHLSLGKRMVGNKEESITSERAARLELADAERESNTLMGVLLVNVIEGTDVKRLENFTLSDPYAVVSFGGKSFRTSILIKTAHPVWKQKFRFAVVNAQMKFDVIFTVFDADVITKHGFIGTSTLPLSDVRKIGVLKQWVELRSSQHRDQGEVVGKIQVELEFVDKDVIEKKFWSTVTSNFDTNGDHKLDRFELAAFFQAMGYSLSKSELSEVFKKLARKDDRLLSPLELSQLPEVLPDGFRVIRFQECPICGRSLRKASDGALVCHVGLCVEERGDHAVDEILAKNLITEQNASASWAAQIFRAITFSTYSNSKGRILVQSRKTGALIEEKVPPYVKVPLMIMYQTFLGKTSMRTNDGRKLLKKMTVEFGPRYTDPASKKLIADFIKLHDLDVTEVEKPLNSFPNFNEFFYRTLKPGVRPISGSDDPAKAVCAADSRCLVFPRVADATRLWIKGKHFSLKELMGDNELAQGFEKGSVVIFRLAPQDYHRYHCPVDGVLRSITPIDGAYFTVSPLAVRTDIDIFTENKRTMLVIDTDTFGPVVMMVIGATCVGSIIITHPLGPVKKGEEIGYFAFGGSTVIVVFQKGTIKFDHDLLENSGKPLETLVQYGTSLGKARHVHQVPYSPASTSRTLTHTNTPTHLAS
mmetsp:Transcript_364/g.716  ORF Transcript_364/g.716 Transcript_364/m.716 type:complete len:709 (+) Transcript_364:57-2183(+)